MSWFSHLPLQCSLVQSLFSNLFLICFVDEKLLTYRTTSILWGTHFGAGNVSYSMANSFIQIEHTKTKNRDPIVPTVKSYCNHSLILPYNWQIAPEIRPGHTLPRDRFVNHYSSGVMLVLCLLQGPIMLVTVWWAPDCWTGESTQVNFLFTFVYICVVLLFCFLFSFFVSIWSICVFSYRWRICTCLNIWIKRTYTHIYIYMYRILYKTLSLNFMLEDDHWFY